MKYCRIAGLLLFALSTLQVVGSPGPQVEVSMIQLIANPDRFDGKQVVAIGFFEAYDEGGDVLYVSRESYEHVMDTDSVAVTYCPGDRRELSDKYVMVQGTFRRGAGSHLLLQRSGAIEAVTSCTIWSTLDNPRINRYRPHAPTTRKQHLE